MKRTFGKFLAITGIMLAPLSGQQGKDGFLPLAEGLTPLDSESGRTIFNGSASAPFWKLIQFYNIQPNLATCGVASCTTVLNALPIERPSSATHGEFRIYTADNFFAPAVSAIVPREKVYKSGMSLLELGKVLATFPVKASTVPAAGVTVDRFREDLKACTASGEKIMLVNYLRKSLGQETGGHISPVGAFSAERDLVLVLDVSTYKYPWIWVEAPKLFAAMGGNAKDGVSRGYVTVIPAGK